MSRTPHRILTKESFRILVTVLFFLAALVMAGAGMLGFGPAAAKSSPPNSGAPQQATAQTKTTAEPKASAAAASALEKLRQTATTRISSHVGRQTGIYDIVRAEDGGVLTTDSTGGSPESRAFAFLRQHGALIGMTATERQLANGAANANSTAASVLKVARAVKDSIGGSHVRMNQFYRGLPVFAAQVVVHMNDHGITGISGQFVPQVQITTTPKITESAAQTIALRTVGSSLQVAKIELSIYRKGLLEGYMGQSVLAYNVEVTDGGTTHVQVWIDALKGTVLNNIPLSHPVLHRIIYTPQYDPAFAVRHEGDPYTPGATPGTTGADPINNLYLFAGQTYNLFKSTFNRDAYDGAGHIMESVLLISTNPNVPCPNAYWNGVTTNYCPDFDADDVVAHEWGHAYTQYTHGLIYSYQAGGLNEAYSDIFGEAVDLLNGVDAEGGSNNSQPLPDGQRWQVGDDVPTVNAEALGLLRDMWTPTRYSNPDRVSSEFYDCAADAVHTTSGVPGHAFAMLVDGKTFNGQTVEGIGLTRALHIYYRAMTVYQTPGTNFAMHEQALVASCNDLIGQPLNAPSTDSTGQTVSGEVITAQTCQQVSKAMLAVEMSADINARCNYRPILEKNTPEACPGSINVFAEDWETGEDGWTKTSTGVTPDWEDSTRNLRDWALDSTLPGGVAGYAAHARNIPLSEPGGGTCSAGGDYSGQFTIDSPTISVPADADELKVSFDHYIATEATFDGGQLEVSVNGGAFQLVPQEQYEFNAPNSALMGAADGNTNPNAGELAWNGTDQGSLEGSWGTTIVNLSSLTNPGDTIKLRFTLSQDGCNGVDGWYVDNIRVYYCPVLEPPTLALGADYQEPDPDGSYTLTWTRPNGAVGPDTLQQSTSSCAPLISENAESGLGQWTVTTSGTATPGLAWEAATDKPQHTGTSFRARGTNAVASAASMLTYNTPLTIPGTGTTTLRFSDWNVNEGDDGVFVEVSTDGTNWTAVYQDIRSELAPDGLAAFATEPFFDRAVDLTSYAGQTVRLRFRYQMGAEDRSGSVPLGWYVDDIALQNDSWSNVVTTNNTSYLVSGAGNGTRCYRVNTSYQLGTQTAQSPFSNVVTATVSRVIVPPSVNITSPTEGAAFTSGSNITIIASAGDSDGTVSKVEFFEGSNKLGEDTSGPDYRVTWNSVAQGNYTLTAVATDNDGGSNTSTPVHITVTAAPTTDCMEDDDPRIAYSNGWHLGNDPNASAGHFRYNTGKDTQNGVLVDFEVPAGKTGKITYYFARSTKKGTADIYLDGAFKETINYQGGAGSMQHPEFNEAYQVSYGGLGGGKHTLEIRNPRDVVFVDRFCLESASSNAQPLAGPGNTTNGNQNVGGGKSASSNYAMDPGATEISVVASSTLAVPFQLVLVDPSGLAVETVNSSSGLATINRPVTTGGIYVIKVVNLSLGPVQITTAATPLVKR